MFRIIVITSPDFFAEESDIINYLFKAGLYRLHIRKPKASIQQTEKFINMIDKTYHKRLVLHDYHELAIKYSLGGIHLNSRNPHAPSGYNNIGTISCSCHSLQEIKKRKEECDYLTLSPIFDSISKAGYSSNFTFTMLKEAKDACIIDNKIYALGGIDDENISIIKHLGFGGAMVLGYIWENNGSAAIDKFKKLIEETN